MDYAKKMTDIDAKIKELKQQKKDLKKKHELDDLKLKLSKQSEQIAQLTADNRELKAKLAETDMQTVPFPADKKLADLSAQLKEQKRLYAIINNRYGRALWAIKDLSKQYGLDLDPIMARIKVEPSDESDEEEK